MPREGILFILIGPSGSGKNTLMKRVQTQIADLPQLPTYTTRKIRPNEREGREHYFVSRAKFRDRMVFDALVEYQKVHMGDFYGVPRRDVEAALDAGCDLIADIDFLGANRVHAAYPDNTVLIFVTPSRLETLDERIRARGDITPEELENRLARTRFEMTFAPHCHYLILNDLLEPAVEHLRQIVLSERFRRRNSPIRETLQQTPLTPPVIRSAAVALLQHEGKLLIPVDSSMHILPTFPIEGQDTLPHKALQKALQTTLGCEITIDALADERFSFVAPHYMTLGAIPHDIYLYYYYQCTVVSPLPSQLQGWDWRSPVEIQLPAALQNVIIHH